MSVFLDLKTGKMFNTLAELKAFQRKQGEVKASPSLLVANSVEEVKEIPKEEPKEPKEETDQLAEMVHFDSIKGEAEVKINLTREEMVDVLRANGFDGRTTGARVTDEAIAETYMNFITKIKK